jgi:23S rRNA (guanosine2251-2'-O)-methyltransferase
VAQRVEIVYGRRAVAEARRGRRRVHRVFTREELADRELTELAGSPDHQGVVAEVDPYPYAGEDEPLRGDAPLVVALDQVQDPRNLGAICRAADGAGATGVVIPVRRAAAVTAAACKASAGAVEHLAVARVTNLVRWLERAKAGGAWSYGADAAAATPYTDVDLCGPTVLVLGGEGGGLRRLVAERCDARVSIPLAGRIESLNVAAAAAVLLFEARRQRDASGGTEG